MFPCRMSFELWSEFDINNMKSLLLHCISYTCCCCSGVGDRLLSGNCVHSVDVPAFVLLSYITYQQVFLFCVFFFLNTV